MCIRFFASDVIRHTMNKQRPKICTGCRVSKAKFYLYHRTKIAKARPGFDDQTEHPFIQINYSSPWLSLPCNHFKYITINLRHS